MSIICPTLTATDIDQFSNQIKTVSQFAKRVHLDIADGLFAPKLLDVNKIWLPDILTDIHVMYENPEPVIDKLINLKPHLIIVHYESEADFNKIAQALKSNNIKFGIALLQQTDVSVLRQLRDILDHVLIFSGNLGFFGGNADISLMTKASSVKELNPDIEVGWDGGINLSNTKILDDHQVDVLNVGGYIHKSKDPKQAFLSLVESIEAVR
jgi:ribulose-phosphate 3-epimerase